jgi:glutamyl-tRNA synthetase
MIGAYGWSKLERALPGLKERAKTLVELLDNANYLFVKRPLLLDAQAEKLLDKAGRARLAALLPRLEAVEPWTQAELDAAVRRYADDAAVKLGKVAQPLRAALTGKATSPGIFEVLEVLGREESLGRIRDKALITNSA